MDIAAGSSMEQLLIGATAVFLLLTPPLNLWAIRILRSAKNYADVPALRERLRIAYLGLVASVILTILALNVFMTPPFLDRPMRLTLLVGALVLMSAPSVSFVWEYRIRPRLKRR